METASTPAPPDDTGRFQVVKLLKRHWLSENAFEIELTRPASFVYKAGHNIVFLYESTKRYYSLISAPQDPVLSLCIHYVKEGHFSPILAAAELGTQFNITGPHGYFTFQPSPRPPIFVATGTGIAPFVSMARSGVTNFVLFHEAISSQELYYQSYFRKLIPNYFACLTETSYLEGSLLDAHRGEISVCLQKNLSPNSYDFYLCGHRKMVRDVTLLVDDIYPGSRVFREVFY